MTNKGLCYALSYFILSLIQSVPDFLLVIFTILGCGGGKPALRIAEVLLGGGPEDQAEDLEWMSGLCLNRCNAAFCSF